MAVLRKFTLPAKSLSSLPTGAVKDVVEQLGRHIVAGRYGFDQTMPTEAVLAIEFGVSRTVLREAVKVLSAKKMLRTARRYGTRVCHFEEWHLLDPDVIRWHGPDSPMAPRVYREATELRLIVEPEAAHLAALHASQAQRQTILEAASAIQPEPFGLEAMIAADFTFHATILEATGNVMLSQLHSLILALLQFSYPAGASAAPDEKVSRERHIEVAKSIMARDAGSAREQMRQMLYQNRAIADRFGEERAAIASSLTSS